jgi:hypothetical protein
MRMELKAIGLDWDRPEFPPKRSEAANPPPVVAEVDSGTLL